MANYTNTTGNGQFIKEYWRDKFLTELRANLVFEQFGLKSVHPKNQGTMVHWLSLADFSAAGAISSEVFDPVSNTVSAGEITATVSQYGGSVKISDLLQQTWIENSYDELIERLARNAALTMDTVVRDACMTANGTVQYAGTAVSRNSIATDGSFDADIAEIREAVNTLAKANVPRFPNGYYAGIVHPDVTYDLQGDTAWTDPNKYAGSENIFKGETGRMYGVKFVETTMAPELAGSGSASTDVYQSYILGPEAFGISELQGTQIIVKNPHPASDLNVYGTMGWKGAFAAKELSATRMVRLESGAAMGT